MRKWTKMLTVILGLALLGGCAGSGVVKIDLSDYDYGNSAEVFVDGDFKGKMLTDTYEITLPEGTHELELIQTLSDPNHYDQLYVKQTITVADKSTQSLLPSWDLRQSPDYKTQLEEKHRKQMKILIASIQSNMVTIPSGSFQMGSNDGDSDEKPVHTVQIKSFRMGKYEVTQAQWQAVIDNNPSKFKGGNHPVERVSWNDVQAFIKILNEQSDKKFRLPSEAEWEYAARAGSSGKYSWGNDIGKNQANCNGCGSQWDNTKTAPVGSFSPNSFGLYDMHGNVWEWVQDCWNDGYIRAPSDGSAWLTGDCRLHAARGGSWFSSPKSLRSANHSRAYMNASEVNLGFRLAHD